jgi:hypothetical protein
MREMDQRIDLRVIADSQENVALVEGKKCDLSVAKSRTTNKNVKRTQTNCE